MCGCRLALLWICVQYVLVCKCTCVGMFVYVCACNKVHLATELSSGAPGVSVAHAPPPLAAAVLLSGDTPAHLNGRPNFLPATSIALGGLTNPSCGDRTANHKINFSRCSISKEINFCDRWIIVSLWHYIRNWQICNTAWAWNSGEASGLIDQNGICASNC